MRTVLLAIGAILSSGLSPPALQAGGGPENVLLVVNANSPASKEIANHWIRFRSIPTANVVYLDWKPLFNNCSGKDYLEGILEPALAAIESRKLSHQIDYIVFSSDFPWRVDLRDLVTDDRGKPSRPIASLNGATYLWQLVRAKNPMVTSLVGNHYAAQGKHKGVGAFAPTRGFRSRYKWDQQGGRASDGAHSQYMLSTMLAVTTGRGNTVDEAIRYLQRAAMADATHPDGTVYFLKNSDVRSKTRHGLYQDVAHHLGQLGRSVQILDGVLPLQKPDVLGLMTGTKEFDLAASSTKILPGAICDHLTSYGGIMQSDAHHTPLSEFLRHGAAGASGTVFEPYALQQKFPRPEVHLHYARGASLAEAFYQSVSGPYQLLVVGDPLCQPFAIRPQVDVGGIEPDQVIRGTITLFPKAILPAGRSIARYELYVDGHLVDILEPGREYNLDTTRISDGYHEVRVVGVDASPLEFQGRHVLPVWVDNHDGEISLSADPRDSIPSGGKLTVTASSPGAESILILQHSRTIGQIQGSEGQQSISAEALGKGPVSLRAVAIGERPVFSKPVWLLIE